MPSSGRLARVGHTRSSCRKGSVVESLFVLILGCLVTAYFINQKAPTGVFVALLIFGLAMDWVLVRPIHGLIHGETIPTIGEQVLDDIYVEWHLYKENSLIKARREACFEAEAEGVRMDNLQESEPPRTLQSAHRVCCLRHPLLK
jgi:hypothetical protein